MADLVNAVRVHKPDTPTELNDIYFPAKQEVCGPNGGAVPVDIGSATLSVTADGVEIKNDVGNPVPVAPNVQQGGGAVTSTTTRVTLATDGPGVANLASIAGLQIPAHDYIALSYTGTNLTGVVYKTGGSGGTTVATLTLAYSGSNLTSVTKS